MQSIWDWLLNLNQARLSGEGHLDLATPWPVWLAFIVSVALIALVATVYRRDGGTAVGRTIGAVLRCLLLALLLLLIWQPVIRVERRQRQPGVVAVIVDMSRSMATADTYGADDPLVAEMARLAGPPTTQPSAADPLLTEALQRLTEKDKTRIDVVREMLAADGNGAIKKLLANNDLAFYTFARAVSRPVRLPQQKDSFDPAIESQLAAALNKLDKSVATDNATNIKGSLAKVLEDLRGQRLAGVVVISDGRATDADDQDDPVKLATSLPVPIHTVTVGSVRPPKDLAVNRVVAEPIVFVKDWVAVKALIGQHGFEQPELAKARLVRLTRKAVATSRPDGVKHWTDDYDYEDLSSQDVTVGETAAAEGPSGEPAVKREVETELRYQPDRPGEYTLGVVVESPGGKDRNPGNDISVVQLVVKDAQIRVLLIDDLPRWEYRFVAHSLIREKTVTFSAMLLSADEDFAQEADTGAAIARLPESPEEWQAFDVVILGDVSPMALTQAQMEQIEAFVRDRGGGFAMVSGEHYSPHRYAGTPIARLLPVEIDQNAAAERINRTAGFKMRLRHEGRLSPILRFERRPELNEATIAAFPDFYWFKPVMALKPGAEVLCEHPVSLLPDGHPAPLMVCGRYGAGKTFFSAIDSTWRWRYHTGTPFFDTYWLQLVRYLSRAKLLDTDRRFELSTDQTEYDRGQRVRVTLTLLDRDLGQTLALPESIKVLVIPPRGKPSTLTLARSGYVYEGDFKPTGDGDWTFELDAEMVNDRFGPPSGGYQQIMPRVQVHVFPNSPEDKNLAIDAVEFPRLATQTNGVSVTAARLGQLGQLIRVTDAGQTQLAVDQLLVQADLDAANENATRQGLRPAKGRELIPDMSIDQAAPPQDFALWNTRLALFAFAILITAEWILRKRYNLQ